MRSSSLLCPGVDGRVYTWGGVYRTDHLALGHGPDDDDSISSARLVPYVSNAVHVAAGGTRDGAASSLVRPASMFVPPVFIVPSVTPAVPGLW